MRKLREIILNEYDEKALEKLLISVISEKQSEFISLCLKEGMDFESISAKEDIQHLRWECSPELKEHLYYIAVLLYSELEEARTMK